MAADVTAHLVALDEDWSLWRWTALRGAGFPVGLLRPLAAPDVVAAERAWLARVEAAEAVRADFAARCEAAAGGDPRHRARAVLRKLKFGKVPQGPLDDAALEEHRVRYAAALGDVAAARAAIAAPFEAARIATARWLREVIADDRFRRAVLWQSRGVVARALDALARQPETATDSKTRQNERLVASYLQRYCAKNDTIGFFGPTGWARFEDGARVVTQRPGQGVETGRRVYFEYWAIDTLAQALAADPALRPYLAPRLLPQFRIEGTTLVRGRDRNALPPEFAQVAAACDGERDAFAIAAALGSDPSDVCDLLSELAESGVVTWTLEVPTATIAPEDHLARALARIANPAARSAEAALVRLVAGRDAVAAARTAGELDAALVRLGELFTELTGAADEREGGKTYAARALVFEECVRDSEVTFGAPFLDRLRAPLSLILTSTRWFTHEIARRYRAAAHAIYARMATAEAPVVDFQQFWREAIALFPGPKAGIVAEVRDELQRRWHRLLAPDHERVVVRSARSLAHEVRATFAAPGPGWPAARHQSPDVLVAASPEGLANGELRFVLGEVHVGMNTLGPAFVKMHPTPETLIADRDADLKYVGIAPVWSKAITSADYYSLSPGDLDLEVGETRSARPRDQVIAMSALEVVAENDALVVRTRDRKHAFDIIELLEHHLIAESFSAFSLIAADTHTPRIVIDDLVIAREAWRVDPATLAWPKLEDACERFLEARRWARALMMPRWVFVRTPEETKPSYVDFDSPMFVDLLAKNLRSATHAVLSEMLPDLDAAWLADEGEGRYTSELRIVAVDAR